MSLIRKTALSVLAGATIAAAATVLPVTSASANGYGYYSPGNGYYGYGCRWIRQRYWTGYGWGWRRIKVCS